MSEPAIQDSGLKPLLDRMVAARQLSAQDAVLLRKQQQAGGGAALQTEEDILRWLAHEYGLTYTGLDDSVLNESANNFQKHYTPVGTGNTVDHYQLIATVTPRTGL